MKPQHSTQTATTQATAKCRRIADWSGFCFLKIGQFIRLLSGFVLISLLIACKDKKPIDPDHNVSGFRYYEWAKPENVHKPRPSVYELRFGQDEKNMNIFRIEREFVISNPQFWDFPVELHLPMAMLDGKITAQQYIAEYKKDPDHYKMEKKYPMLAIIVSPNSAGTGLEGLTPEERENLIRQKQAEHPVNLVNMYGYTCEKQPNKINGYYFCDLFNRDKKFLRERYYWSADPKNVDPIYGKPITFYCNLKPERGDEFCTIDVKYDEKTSLFKGLMVVDMDYIPSNSFVVANYMPQIIQFLNQRKVN